MYTQKYTKGEISNAFKIVSYFESRKEPVRELRTVLKSDLKNFPIFRFDVDEKNRFVKLFYCKRKENGRVDRKMMSTEAHCEPGDLFDESIGKYICVKRAMGEKPMMAYNLIEPSSIYVGDHNLLYNCANTSLFRNV